MTASVVLAWCLSWIAAHPTEFVLMLTAGASLLVKPLETKWPWLSKLCAVFSQFGVNIPGILSQLKSKAPAVVAKVAAEEAKKLAGK